MSQSWYDVILNFFWHYFVSLVNLVMSKFQVSINDTIITGSGVMIIYFYKGLTRNLEIPVWALPKFWKLGRVRDTKIARHAFNGMLLYAAKARVTAFTVSELLRENQQGEGLNYH